MNRVDEAMQTKELHLSIEYRVSEPGHRLCLCVANTCLSSEFEQERYPMSSLDGIIWHCKLILPSDLTELSYNYILCDSKRAILRRESPKLAHFLCLKGFESETSFETIDSWIDPLVETSFSNSAFLQVFYPHSVEPLSVSSRRAKCRYVFQCYCATLTRSSRLFLCGSVESLGKWDSHKAVPMSYIGKGYWACAIDAEDLVANVEYKYFISNEKVNNPNWELGENRQIPKHKKAEGVELLFIHSQIQYHPADRPRFAGTVIPLFAIRSEEDWGIGDFSSLERLIDWAALTKQSYIQLLPINDCTFYRDQRDSYPYKAISVMALHPIYVAPNPLLQALPEKVKTGFLNRASQLRALNRLDYPAVLTLKEELLKHSFEAVGDLSLATEAYQTFYSRNQDWLRPYALFCTLRDSKPGLELEEWHEFSYDKEAIDTLSRLPQYQDSINYYCYVQFVLHEQLLGLSQQASTKHVVLKGDIPIGISPNSVDLWLYPQLFDPGQHAGAPPDDFSREGQNWGFPCYQWQAMEQDNFDWWCKRLKHMSQYFHAYRIDHILGFFRIWQIPSDQCSGLLGQFNPSLPLSQSEIEEYGLGFDPELACKAMVHQDDMQLIWGEGYSQLCPDYIQLQSNGYYCLQPAYQSQRAIAAIDSSLLPDGEKSKQGLMRMASELLFLPDQSLPHHYHPRIQLQKSLRFARINSHEQELLLNLSHDYFYRRNDALWMNSAIERLRPLISSTELQVCAEDLGMIPASVPKVLVQLQLLSLELERMPKVDSVEFSNPDQFPYLSVATTSTHDMPSLRQWYEMDIERTERYVHSQLNHGKVTDRCTPNTATQILSRLLASPSMLAIIPLSDWMAISSELQALQMPEDEQINRPENPSHYWDYRIPLTIEALIDSYPSFNGKVAALISESGRAKDTGT